MDGTVALALFWRRVSYVVQERPRLPEADPARGVGAGIGVVGERDDLEVEREALEVGPVSEELRRREHRARAQVERPRIHARDVPAQPRKQ